MKPTDLLDVPGSDNSRRRSFSLTRRKSRDGGVEKGGNGDEMRPAERARSRASSITDSLTNLNLFSRSRSNSPAPRPSLGDVVGVREDDGKPLLRSDAMNLRHMEQAPSIIGSGGKVKLGPYNDPHRPPRAQAETPFIHSSQAPATGSSGFTGQHRGSTVAHPGSSTAHPSQGEEVDMFVGLSPSLEKVIKPWHSKESRNVPDSADRRGRRDENER